MIFIITTAFENVKTFFLVIIFFSVPIMMVLVTFADAGDRKINQWIRQWKENKYGSYKIIKGK